MQTTLHNFLFFNDNPDSIFSVLTREQLKELNETSVLKKIKKGDLIFKEGELPKGLIFLLKGSAKVYKTAEGRREQIVRLIKPSCFVGYKALFAEHAHTTSAEAIENSELIIYNKQVLYEILEQNSVFSKEIIKALANELGFNYNRIINLTQKHIRGRLAETLLLIKDIYGIEDDGKTLKAKFTRENIAHFSNMTTSNAIRTLKTFSDEKLIYTDGRKITLLNIPLLEKISKTG